jgi:hypothetical protein
MKEPVWYEILKSIFANPALFECVRLNSSMGIRNGAIGADLMGQSLGWDGKKLRPCTTAGVAR